MRSSYLLPEIFRLREPEALVLTCQVQPGNEGLEALPPVVQDVN
ncbi:hypothetical protein [Fischerella sp. PCC 9605]|nr:hypothetical protein [Fischerella sp. PCC 9605]